MIVEKPWLSKLKPFAYNNIQWEAFIEMIDAQVEMNVRKLEASVETVDLYRAQGAVMALKQLKHLRDEIAKGDK
jgi:hypothetical protein